MKNDFIDTSDEKLFKETCALHPLPALSRSSFDRIYKNVKISVTKDSVLRYTERGSGAALMRFVHAPFQRRAVSLVIMTFVFIGGIVIKQVHSQSVDGIAESLAAGVGTEHTEEESIYDQSDGSLILTDYGLDAVSQGEVN